MLNAQPSVEFGYEGAKIKLVNLNLGADEAHNIIFTTPGDELAQDNGYGNQGSMGRQGRLMRLAAWINLDSKLTVRVESLGMLAALINLLGGMCWSHIELPFQTKVDRLSSQRPGCLGRFSSKNN